MAKRTRLAFGAVGIVLLAATATVVLDQSKVYDLDGLPVHVKVDSISLCVGRRFIEPDDLERLNCEKGPITAGSLDRRAVSISLFSEALAGYIDAHYKDGIATTYDKRFYPADWMRIYILPQSSRRPVGVPPKDYLQSFDAEWTLDLGFRSHKRHQDCVGKSVVWGALSAVTLGPECLDTEIKYGNATAPEVVLYCNPMRCDTSNYLELQGVSLEYGFPRVFLQNWPTLHAGILKGLSAWRTDTSCYQ